MVTAPPLPTVIFHPLALLTVNLSPPSAHRRAAHYGPDSHKCILSALLVSHWGLQAFGSSSVVGRLHDSRCRQSRDGWRSFHVRLPNLPLRVEKHFKDSDSCPLTGREKPDLDVHFILWVCTLHPKAGLNGGS